MKLKHTGTVLLIGFALVLFTDRRTGSSIEDTFIATTHAAREAEAMMCVLPPELQEHQGRLDGTDLLPDGNTPAVRMVFDPHPSFNGIAIDPLNDLVLFSDSNRKSLLLYHHGAGGRGDDVTPPLRRITGPSTGIGFVAGVVIDPEHRELMTVNNDIEDRMVVFDYDDHGNAAPKRTLYVPHQAWGLALSQKRDEIVFSVQTPNMLVWYRREATALEPPVRVVRGHRTLMADPRGVAVDDAHDEVFVANHGNWRPQDLITSYTAYDARDARQEEDRERGVTEDMRGRFLHGSVTVYPASAGGDVPPKRTIAGPRTELNWPMGVAVDARHGEIAVASNGNDAVLIFNRTDNGNVVPTRVLRGPRTGIRSPTGVAIHGDELWVANFGEHTALVFSRTAAGDVAPRRILRNAPKGTPTTGIGNPYAVAYDSRRQQLLVPN